MNTFTATGLAFGLIASAAPVSAATVIFSGSRQNVDAPGPAAARCGVRNTANIRHNPPTSTSTGTSNFGVFTPTLTHCIQLPLSMTGPTPFDLGEFTFAFESGDTLFGTYSGIVTPLSPGLFSIAQSHLVTGGSGLFAGALGSFDSAGTLSFLTGRPTVSQTFSGALDVAGIPEPATWAMLIGGFGFVGGAMRMRKRRERLYSAVFSAAAL